MMKTVLIISTITIALLFPVSVKSQGLHTNSNRAVKSYNEGNAAYDYLDFVKAEALFKDALIYDKYFFEAYLMLGELYSKQRKFTDAAENYLKALNIDSMSYRPAFFNLANSEFMTGDYSNAIIHYRTYVKAKNISEKNRVAALKNIKNCEFAIEALKHPVTFNPVNIGNSINSADDEYWPSISADGQIFMFTRQASSVDKSLPFPTSQEDFYLSNNSEKGWKPAINAGSPLNTPQNEGAQTLSSGGNYMYFTACERPGGMGSCDIYFSAIKGGRWSQPFNLGPPVNTSAWESTPSISADGNMLFFSSNRPGGTGGKDLYYSVLRTDKTWSKPVNMGTNINTPGDEMSPFIHFDGKSLYFASDGLPGMGGFDIYMTRMNPDSSWTSPVDLGYPINTYNDETGLIIDATGRNAFFSSRREQGKGKDIYYFDLDESVRPSAVSYLKGKVVDKESGMLLKANYELINLTSDKVSVMSSTDDDGNFLICLPPGQNYGINVSRPGYLFYSESFLFEGEHSVTKPFIKRIALSPIKVGEKIILSNVFYEVDSWELKKESQRELDNLAALIKENKGIILEIGGYTDSTGTDAHNITLSEKRALSVVNYLKSKGVQPDCLVPKGYGNSSPVGNNVTAEGRQLNRRTEAKIIGRK